MLIVSQYNNYLTSVVNVFFLLSPIRCGFALDSQPQVIKFTSCLAMVGGSLRVLPPLNLVAMI